MKVAVSLRGPPLRIIRVVMRMTSDWSQSDPVWRDFRTAGEPSGGGILLSSFSYHFHRVIICQLLA